MRVGRAGRKPLFPARGGLAPLVTELAGETANLMEKLAQEGGRALEEGTEYSPNVKEELRRKE